jgi:predicted nucleotidyltransferase
MATPIWSYRVPEEHRERLKRIAEALKANPRLAEAFDEILSRGSGGPPIGLFKDEAAALDFIRDRLVLSLGPEQIWLFGSRARPEHRPDSDFDILVVLPDGKSGEAHDYRRALEPLLGSGLPCDIVPCSVSEFAHAKDEPGTIANEAFRHGRRLYERRRRSAAA